jgi:guanylate kinase
VELVRFLLARRELFLHSIARASSAGRGAEKEGYDFFFLKNSTFQNQNSQTMILFLKLAKIAK